MHCFNDFHKSVFQQILRFAQIIPLFDRINPWPEKWLDVIYLNIYQPTNAFLINNSSMIKQNLTTAAMRLSWHVLLRSCCWQHQTARHVWHFCKSTTCIVVALHPEEWSGSLNVLRQPTSETKYKYFYNNTYIWTCDCHFFKPWGQTVAAQTSASVQIDFRLPTESSNCYWHIYINSC